MSKTINTTQITTDNLYFDLFDYIKGFKNATVAAEMASSTAWRLDTLLVSGGRQLLKFIKEENFNQGGYQSMSEVLTAMEDAEFSEQCFNEIGTHDAANGVIERLRMLNAQRDQWHEFAKHMFDMTNETTLDRQGNIRSYTIPLIEDEFAKDPALRINETTQRRLKIRSERIAEAEGSPELADKLFERSMQRKADSNKRVASILKEQSSLAHFMFQLALRSDSESAATRSKAFYDLALPDQLVLINNAANAAMRADERAADDRRLTETEYDFISIAAIKAMTDLRKVGTSPRFTRPATESAPV